MKRLLLVLLCAAGLLTACGLFKPTVTSLIVDPVTLPAPDTSAFNVGDATKRPAIRNIGISHYITYGGWQFAPADKATVALRVDRADQVTFYAYTPGDKLDPQTNTVWGAPTAVQHHLFGRWTATRSAPADNPVALYAVAKNAYGSTISPVLFVMWEYNLGRYRVFEP